MTQHSHTEPLKTYTELEVYNKINWRIRLKFSETLCVTNLNVVFTLGIYTHGTHMESHSLTL